MWSIAFVCRRSGRTSRESPGCTIHRFQHISCVRSGPPSGVSLHHRRQVRTGCPRSAAGGHSPGACPSDTARLNEGTSPFSRRVRASSRLIESSRSGMRPEDVQPSRIWAVFKLAQVAIDVLQKALKSSDARPHST